MIANFIHGYTARLLWQSLPLHANHYDRYCRAYTLDVTGGDANEYNLVALNLISIGGF